MKNMKNMKSMKRLIKKPVYETLINKAHFINQDIVVYPRGTSFPDNFGEVVKFLFGEGACVKQDTVNEPSRLIIKGGTYTLQDVRALDADWTFREIEQ
jgi:hypothetical protein